MRSDIQRAKLELGVKQAALRRAVMALSRLNAQTQPDSFNKALKALNKAKRDLQLAQDKIDRLERG